MVEKLLNSEIIEQLVLDFHSQFYRVPFAGMANVCYRSLENG